MDIPKKRKRKDKYDAQLKIAISQEYLSTDLGILSLSKKYNIPKSTVRDFVTWYKDKYTTGLAASSGEPAELISNVDPRSQSDLKVIALQMLIENASKELGVDIVKKFGTKQPKK
jgi:transposase-like protein